MNKLLLAFALASFAFAESPEPTPAFPGQTDAPAPPKSPDFDVQIITDKLDGPWSLAFLPDGNFLVSEGAGRLRVVSKTGAVSAPIEGVPGVKSVGAMAGQHLVRLVLNGDKVVAEEKLLEGRNWRIREVKQGPDGAIYVFANNRLVRLAPKK